LTLHYNVHIKVNSNSKKSSCCATWPMVHTYNSCPLNSFYSGFIINETQGLNRSY